MADKQGFLATFRIDEKLWGDFKNIAKNNQTNASALLIRYIQNIVADGDIPKIASASPHPCLDTDIDAAIKKQIAESLDDGEIGEKIDDCYQSMMVQLNELQSQVYALEQKMTSKIDNICEKSSDKKSPITNDQSPVTTSQPPITRSLVENIRTTLRRNGISASTEQIRSAFVAAGWDGSNYQEIRKDILERLS